MPASFAQPPREFRGVWVATVGNIDWPSKPGLSSEQQRREMIAILDRASQLHLNAIILQVRTACDALYQSNLEPWSAFLTGQQGKPPDPYYDPLKAWVREAHRRGLELHAWFNPFRVSVPSSKGSKAPSHVNRTHPQWVKQYGQFEWLDPGQAGARDWTIRVILDVVRRYDIDGVHIDDYFYPYPVKGLEFPDDASWSRYVQSGGALSRADWRRKNLDLFIERLYRGIKYEKPWVKFGISPFGIYRPGEPPGVTGFDQYNGLYADVKLWLHRGWCDYLSPQLYWKVSFSGQPFGKLLAWWAAQNWKDRNLWPGLYTGRIISSSTSDAARVRGTLHLITDVIRWSVPLTRAAAVPSKSWTASEILDQIAVTRRQPGASGEIHFSMKTLMNDRGKIDEALLSGPYALPAIVPASPWLGGQRPPTPTLWVHKRDGGLLASWSPGWFAARPHWWAVGVCRGNVWSWQTVPGQTAQWIISGSNDGRPGVSAIAVEAVNRVGIASEATIWPAPK